MFALFQKNSYCPYFLILNNKICFLKKKLISGKTPCMFLASSSCVCGVLGKREIRWASAKWPRQPSRPGLYAKRRRRRDASFSGGGGGGAWKKKFCMPSGREEEEEETPFLPWIPDLWGATQDQKGFIENTMYSIWAKVILSNIQEWCGKMQDGAGGTDFKWQNN